WCAHAAEAEVNRRLAEFEERFQFRRQWTFVRPDPCARLKYIHSWSFRPRAQDRVCGEPRPVRENVALHIGNRRQTGGCALTIQRSSEHIVPAFRVFSPKFKVVGLALRPFDMR